MCPCPDGSGLQLVFVVGACSSLLPGPSHCSMLGTWPGPAGHRDTEGTATPLSSHRPAGQMLDSVGNRLKSTFFLPGAKQCSHNMSWSDAQVSFGWRCPQQLLSSAGSAGSRTGPCPTAQALATS